MSQRWRYVTSRSSEHKHTYKYKNKHKLQLEVLDPLCYKGTHKTQVSISYWCSHVELACMCKNVADQEVGNKLIPDSWLLMWHMKADKRHMWESTWLEIAPWKVARLDRLEKTRTSISGFVSKNVRFNPIHQLRNLAEIWHCFHC